MNKYEKIANEWWEQFPQATKNSFIIFHGMQDIFRIWLLETQHTVEQAAELVRDYGVALEYDNGRDFTLFKMLGYSGWRLVGAFYYFDELGNITLHQSADRPILKLSSVVEVPKHTMDERGCPFDDPRGVRKNIRVS